jgi:hypothetical protein
LLEGHNGIYEIIVNDELLFPNPSTRRKIPTNGEVIRRIADYAELLPGKKLPLPDLPTL